MASDLTHLDLLSTYLYQLKTLSSLDDKCIQILDILRKSGWAKVSLCFLNGKFETKKTLYSGYSAEEVKKSEENKLAPEKRKELLSSAVDRWRIIPFYYLPWRDERARRIVSDGLSTEIPLNLRIEWNRNDLLYAPLYYGGRPIAVLTLDEPRDKTAPNKVNLRVPSILHSVLGEIILQSVSEQYLANFQEVYRGVIERGTVGILEFDENSKITSSNTAAEQMLMISRERLLGNTFNKLFEDDILKQIIPSMNQAIESLSPAAVSILYKNENKETQQIDFQFAPIHTLFDFSSMICILTYPKKSDIFNIYSSIIKNVQDIIPALTGDFTAIQTNLIQLFCKQYKLIYPRLYLLSEDRSVLRCIYSYDPSFTDLRFFDHPYNRNSIAANAILDDQILFVSENDKTIRDVRKIWDLLKTKAALAVPLTISSDVKAALVFDTESSNFFLDESKKVILRFFARLISLTFRPAFEKK